MLPEDLGRVPGRSAGSARVGDVSPAEGARVPPVFERRKRPHVHVEAETRRSLESKSCRRSYTRLNPLPRQLPATGVLHSKVFLP